LLENLEFENELENDEKERIIKLIREYEDVCMYGKKKLKTTNVVKHRIYLEKGAKLIAQKGYRESEENKKVIKEEVRKMLENGIIRESSSPYPSPVVIVGKKDNTKRFCVDYRKLNKVTKTDAYPLPRMDDLLEKFRVARWFTTMDLASGYWQIEMEEEDKELTAFVSSQGLYEFNVMPFGLTNAPPTFQRAMDKAFREYIDEFMNVYIDDIVIYSKSFEEHLEHIEKVLKRLREIDMMIKLQKCNWAKRNVEYLGHIVGNNGLEPSPRLIEKVKNMRVPKNKTDIKSFTMLCSYYRKFIKDFSKVTKPMTELLKKDNEFKWEERQQKAFDELKDKLINYPILQHPDYEREFIVMTDASGSGLGAVLSQKDDNGKEYVIAYASRGLRGAEVNYPITELECLAVMFAIQHFHKYLIRRKFQVITDHSALKTLMNVKKIPKGRRGRWIMELQQYKFDIIHRPGKENKNADALSRLI
jgi:hypothetical protein